MLDVVVVGGGIVGLAVAHQLTVARPGIGVAVVEREPALATHQSGRNSGVIHSGLSYAPGSAKARTAVEGSRELVAFCRHHGIAHDVCGKLVVATDPAQHAGLRRLADRGRANGVAVVPLGPEATREREPHVRASGALLVPSTGIVDFRQVALTCAALARKAGAELRVGTAVVGLRREGGRWLVLTDRGELAARALVTCGGLHSDRLARLAGVDPGVRIVPFRGEYRELVPERRHLVRHLVYPLPDPALPFLGVHLTRDVHGGVHAGPNAVPALSRHGYRWADVSPRDLGRLVADPAAWRLARHHWRHGAAEVARSASVARFGRAVRRLVPEVADADLVPAPAGVRAQAVDDRGRLVDDFVVVEGPASLHVVNAPSPAATASLAIGRELAARLTPHLPDPFL